MHRLAILIVLVTLAAPAISADQGPRPSLIPEGIRAIATPDDCAIILVSDPTNGTGQGLGWLGIDGAIACEADNSIIVWSDGYAEPLLPAPAPRQNYAPRPLPPVAPNYGPRPLQPPTAPDGRQYIWPEAVESRQFDLDSSIILGPEGLRTLPLSVSPDPGP